MMGTMKIVMKDDESLVSGRSSLVARKLLEAADIAGESPKVVRSHTQGYIVPKRILEYVQSDSVEAEPDGEVDGEDEVEDEVEEQKFDPSKHSVKDVQEYLESADDEERQRVLDAEKEGKARPTLLPDDTEGENQ